MAQVHRGVGVDASPAAGGALGKGDGGGLAAGKRVGDQGLHWVETSDPGAGGAPENEDHVLAGGVGELVGVVAIGAHPGVGGGSIRVDAGGLEAQVHELTDISREDAALGDAGDMLVHGEFNNVCRLTPGSQHDQHVSGCEGERGCG